MCYSALPISGIPDINWQPHTYIYSPGRSIKYIDFKDGDDRNPGTKERPWKHHPWDSNSRFQAKNCIGIHTYCFKRGVIYRGTLVAKESGTTETPIQLTMDPDWGSGEMATIVGSESIQEGWYRCNDEACKDIPKLEREKTWFQDLQEGKTPRMVWEIHDDNTMRIPIARAPNWKIRDPDDPRSEWWELEDVIIEIPIIIDDTYGFKIGDQVVFVSDNENKQYLLTDVSRSAVTVEVRHWEPELTKSLKGIITNGKVRANVKKVAERYGIISRLTGPKNFLPPMGDLWLGATMWAEGWNMPQPTPGKVIHFAPKENSLKIKFGTGLYGPKKLCRYFIEDLPILLDSPGEFYAAIEPRKPTRMFIRLPEDTEPNESSVEIAVATNLIHIHDKNNIIISGLNLKFSNSLEVESKKARHASIHAAALLITGSCENIKISNTEISHVPAGIIGFPRKPGDILDYIEITNNFLHDIDGPAIALSNGRFHPMMDAGARLVHSNIQRNKLENVGYRVLDRWGMGPHAIEVTGGEMNEVAGNIVNLCWGSGIMVFTGSEFARGDVERPLMRTLIYNNKVTNSILGMQDHGAISAWMGGPVFIFNNIVGNPVGYKHSAFKKGKKKNNYRSSSFGVGIYLDSQYKGYVFNNIIFGKNNNVNDRIYNSTAVNEAMGFMHTFFHNTIYRFGVAFHKGMSQHNRSYYLGNLLLDPGNSYFWHEPSPDSIEYASLAYTKNVFNGSPYLFGRLGKFTFPKQILWDENLFIRKAMTHSSGIDTNGHQVINKENYDFRLLSDSVAVDYGVRVFVPYSLYKVVGEWNFFLNQLNPSKIVAENLNWNKEWYSREMMQDIPRNDLTAHNIEKNDFHFGMLEDWVPGALAFNGINQYCSLSASAMNEGYVWQASPCRIKLCSGKIESSERETVDMEENDFLIELVFRSIPELTNAALLSKQKNKGYSLAINDKGFVEMTLVYGKTIYKKISSIPINDGNWHHLLVEADITRTGGINFFIDGKTANGESEGELKQGESLSNNADFLLGKPVNLEKKYFHGTIDFLRISQGTLADAETTIEKLYDWEFKGPFIKDFFGRPANGKRRDAGAVELVN